VRDRHFDDVVGNPLQLFGTAATGDNNEGTLARFHLLDVVQILRQNGVIGSDKDRRKLRPDQSDDAMFELSTRMAFGVLIRDLFHLQRAFERDRKVELPSEKQHAANVSILLGNLSDVIAELKNLIDLVR
jgi:hypothetical protein